MANSCSVVQSIRVSTVRCGLHDKSLQEKKLQIDDAIKFLNELEREVSSQEKWLDPVSIAGILAWSAILVTDIIRNTVKIAPKGGHQLVMKLLDDAHKKASGQKFDGTRYEKEVKYIDEAMGVLRKVVPKEFESLVNLFGDMAKDSLGLAGHIEDSDETKKVMKKSAKTVQKNLSKMKEVLKKIEAKIADDAKSDDEGFGLKAEQVTSSRPPSVSSLSKP